MILQSIHCLRLNSEERYFSALSYIIFFNIIIFFSSHAKNSRFIKIHCIQSFILYILFICLYYLPHPFYYISLIIITIIVMFSVLAFNGYDLLISCQNKAASIESVIEFINPINKKKWTSKMKKLEEFALDTFCNAYADCKISKNFTKLLNKKKKPVLLLFNNEGTFVVVYRISDYCYFGDLNYNNWEIKYFSINDKKYLKAFLLILNNSL